MDTQKLAQHDVVMQCHKQRDLGKQRLSAVQPSALPRIRGWLLVYVTALVAVAVHGAWLTVASIVIYADPAAAGLHSFVPLSFLRQHERCAHPLCGRSAR